MTTTACVYKFHCGEFFYIGSTANLARRHRDHMWRLKQGAHPNPKLQSAFNDNGFTECFPVALVDHYADANDLRNKLRAIEQEKLDFLFNDPKCCNLSPNASGPNNGKIMKDKWTNPEFREKMQNFINSRKGAIVTQETREKMAAAKRGAKNVNARAVIVTSPTGSDRFDSVSDAAKFLRVPQQVLDGWMMGRFPWPGTGTRPAKAHYRHLEDYSARHA